MPKSTLSHHHRILRESGLIVSERHGTELASRVRTAEIESRFPGLLQSVIDPYDQECAGSGRRSARRASFGSREAR